MWSVIGGSSDRADSAAHEDAEDQTTDLQRARPSAARRLAWISIVAGITYLIFVGGTWSGIIYPQFRLLSLTIALVAVAWWAVAARRDASWLPSSSLVPAAAASLGSLAVSTLTSEVPRLGLEYLCYAVLLWALYLLLVRLLAQPWFRTRLLQLCTLLFIGISGVYLAAVAAHWLQFWSLLGGFAVPPLRPNSESLAFGNPSAALAVTTLLAIPTAAGVVTSFRGRALIVAVVIVVAVTTGSRAGWLALAGTAAIGSVAACLTPGGRDAVGGAVRWLTRSRARLGFVGAALAGGLVVAWLAWPAISSRLTFAGSEIRGGYSAQALRLFESSPVTGVGPGMWVVRHVSVTAPDETLYYIPHAHNLESQALAELGVVGVLAGAVVVVAVLRLLWRGIRSADPSNRAWAWAGGIGLVYFTIHHQLDFYLNFPGFLFVAAVPIALLDAAQPLASGATQPVEATVGTRAAWRRERARVAAVALLVVVAAGVGAMLPEGAALDQFQATPRANGGDWAGARSPAAAAATADPEISAYAMTAALAAAHTGDSTEATALFERVARRDDLPEAWLDLAFLRCTAGDRDGALQALRAATRVGSQDPTIAIPAGQLALDLGADEDAVSYFAAALTAQPALAGSGWWADGGPRARAFAAALRTVESTAAMELRFELAIWLGDEDGALRLADTAGADLGGVVSAWFGDAVDRTTLYERCRHTPVSGLVQWCALVAQRARDLVEFDRWRDVAAISGGWLGVPTIDPTGSDGLLIGGAYQWGTYTYRRPTPLDLLVPGLIRIGVR